MMYQRNYQKEECIAETEEIAYGTENLDLTIEHQVKRRDG
ncbi:unnamed protein product [marine sediment metagenome]|uniref:Uncharacterized protein n=1 Tax=marine sediment metagenome TaxID=412755 RepID=X1TZ95_9ZZZZ